MTLVLVFISSYCAFGARNVYVYASLSPDQLQPGYWTNTKRRCKLHNKLASFHPCIHASLPFLLVSVWLGAINKQRTASPQQCLYSLSRIWYTPPLSTWAWREIKSWLHYNGIFCKFQENSFDIFLPYIAYYHNWLNRPPIFRSITILYTTLHIGSRQFTGSLEVCYNANDITNYYPIAAALQNIVLSCWAIRETFFRT